MKTGDKIQKSKTGKPEMKAAGSKSGTGKTGGKPVAGAKSGSGKSYGKPAAKTRPGKGKSAGKQTAGFKPWENSPILANNSKKTERELRSLLYLLPKKVSAKELAKDLDFIPAKEIEIWDEEGVLEISTREGVVTFEDIRESLGREDDRILSGLGMKQVLACDYESANAALVRRILETFLEKHGGRIGSDTEDFTPFLSVEEI